MRSAALAVVMVLSCAGCVRYTPHPWSQTFEFVPSDVEFVSPEKLSRVQKAQEADAIKRLDQHTFLRLTAKEYRTLSRSPIELQDSNVPYLVRGVSWSEPPWFSIVAMDREKKILFVIQYTTNFELAWPSLHWRMRPYPVIAVLDREIEKALAQAVIGGDRIMGDKMYYGEKAWDEWSE